MTAQKRDVEEVLSRALHSETDQVEPVGDGLTKIRARLSEPWLKRRWWLLRNESMTLGWFVAVRCASLFSTIRGSGAGPGDEDPATGPAGAGHGLRRRVAPIFGGAMAWITGKGDSRRSAGPVMNWLRPALAVAGAVVLVVAGVFALGQIRQSIQAGLSAGGGGYTSGTSSQTSGPGSTNGRGSSPSLRGNGTRTSQSSTSPKTGASHPAGAVPSSSPCPSPANSPPASPQSSPTAPPPSPTPSGSPTPTGTATPTATPTASTSQAPASSLRAVKDRDRGGTRTTALVCVPVGPSPSASASPA